MKTKQPTKVPVPDPRLRKTTFPVAGYPETGIGMDDVLVKGKFMKGTPQKTYSTVRGAGAATRGVKFLNKYI